MAGVIPQYCATRSRPSSTLHPSKRDNDALEERTATNPTPIWDDAVTPGERSTSPPSPPTLCSHPQRYAAILGTAKPSPTLWDLCWRDAASLAVVQSKPPRELDPQIGVRTTTKHGRRQGHPRNRLLTGTRVATTRAGTRIRQDNLQITSTAYRYRDTVHKATRHNCKPPLLGL
jgi:hypothetical protein